MNNVYSLQKTFEGRVFAIPNYQRGYAWDEPQLMDLWEDIEFLAPGKKHYTGNLVLQKRNGEPARAEDGTLLEVFDVVDGQQRLTTLVILLDCLRPSFQKDKPGIAAGILSSYVKYTDINGQPAYRLSLNADCRDFFIRNVLGDNGSPAGATIISHERLSAAKKFFTAKIAEKALREDFAAWRDDFRDRVTQRLELGQYCIDDSSDVGVVFEVMNNRGKPLSELEKVKNYLLYLSSKLAVTGHNLAGKIDETWAVIFTRLMAAGLVSAEIEDRLLRAHWLMAYDPDRKQWDGSKSIKKEFHLRIDPTAHKRLLGQLIKYVDSLRDAAVTFCDVMNPTRSGTFGSFPEAARGELRLWMEKLARNGVRSSFLPLLMAAIKRFPNNSKACLRLIKALELYEFRVFRWAGKRSNAGETRLIRLAFDLYREDVAVDALCNEIITRAHVYLSNADFKEGFAPAPDNNFYTWPGLRYMLYEYELSLANGRNVHIRWDQLQSSDWQKTIEHILPQTPSKPYWQKRFDKDAIQKFTNALGNLSLTLDNSSYGNKEYPDKRGSDTAKHPCYATSSLFMERKVANDYTDWTPVNIEERGDTIRDWALSRWHVDSALLGQIQIENSDVEENEEKG